MDTFFQQPANRAVIVSHDSFHVIVKINVQENLTGVMAVRLSAAQAKQLAGNSHEMLRLECATPPKGIHAALWHTPLPDGSSHLAISYNPTPDDINATWLGVLLSAEDVDLWRNALHALVARIE